MCACARVCICGMKKGAGALGTVSSCLLAAAKLRSCLAWSSDILLFLLH